MNDEVLPRRRQAGCAFDPRRACGSHSRTKLAYRRRELEDMGSKCGIPNASSLSLDALCQLLKQHALDKKLRSDFLQTFNSSAYRSIPIPIEVPFLEGTLTPSNAAALIQDEAAMNKLRRLIEEAETQTDDPVLITKGFIAASIFFPDEEGLQGAHDTKLTNAFRVRMLRLL